MFPKAFSTPKSWYGASAWTSQITNKVFEAAKPWIGYLKLVFLLEALSSICHFWTFKPLNMNMRLKVDNVTNITIISMVRLYLYILNEKLRTNLDLLLGNNSCGDKVTIRLESVSRCNHTMHACICMFNRPRVHCHMVLCTTWAM